MNIADILTILVLVVGVFMMLVVPLIYLASPILALLDAYIAAQLILVARWSFKEGRKQ